MAHARLATRLTTNGLRLFAPIACITATVLTTIMTHREYKALKTHWSVMEGSQRVFASSLAVSAAGFNLATSWRRNWGIDGIYRTLWRIRDIAKYKRVVFLP